MKALLAKLKSETFILDLAPKSPLPKLDGYQYRLVDTATLEVEVLREQGINSVFTQLSEQGIQVLSMRNKANRLEELFVSLVNEKQRRSHMMHLYWVALKASGRKRSIALCAYLECRRWCRQSSP